MAKKKKLPKTIAGVKLSKPVRKAGGRILEAAATPKGREVIATGLAMVAAAAARSKGQPAAPVPPTPPAPPVPADGPVPPRPPEPPARGAGTPPQGTFVDPAQVIDALSAAAGAFMGGLLGRKDAPRD